jgi:outer membrane lipoprotein-sorting protein
MSESGEERLNQVFEGLAAPLDPGLERRAVRAMTAYRPARLTPKMRMGVIAAGAAAAVLLALGLLPFSGREGDEAFARLYAAAEKANSIHIIALSRYGGNESEIEIWGSKDGVYRYEEHENGAVVLLELQGPNREVFYRPGEIREYEQPALPAEEIMETAVGRSLGTRAALEKLLSGKHTTSVSERREHTLSGEEYDVIEVERELDNNTLERVIAWLEVDSGRLVSLEKYMLVGGVWEQTYMTALVEWDVELPEDVAEFEPPPGTTVIRSDWWRRTDSALAGGETADWAVTLHAIDVNRRGDLYLTLSWAPKPGKSSEGFDTDEHPRVSVTSGDGVSYEQNDSASCITRQRGPVRECFWAITMLREGNTASPNLPQTVDITIRPFPRQEVTFYGIPLPPRQETDNPRQEEVIQY